VSLQYGTAYDMNWIHDKTVDGKVYMLDDVQQQ